MNELREQLIEAGAKAIAASINDPWAAASQFQRNVFRARATTALDAFLDTLASRADEWDEAALALARSENPPYSMIESFIAALRVEGEEE